jgi:hypothetical protein
MKKTVYSILCLSLFLSVSAFAQSSSNSVSLADFAKDPKNSAKILEMNQLDAESYCKQQGTRLPTIRELATYAQAERNVKGIAKTNYPDIDVESSDVQSEIDKMNNNFYEPVYKIGKNNALTIDFYFSNTFASDNYVEPLSYRIWSSSPAPIRADIVLETKPLMAYVLNLAGNYLDAINVRNVEANAVRCIKPSSVSKDSGPKENDMDSILGKYKISIIQSTLNSECYGHLGANRTWTTVPFIENGKVLKGKLPSMEGVISIQKLDGRYIAAAQDGLAKYLFRDKQFSFEERISPEDQRNILVFSDPEKQQPGQYLDLFVIPMEQSIEGNDSKLTLSSRNHKGTYIFKNVFGDKIGAYSGCSEIGKFEIEKIEEKTE